MTESQPPFTPLPLERFRSYLGVLARLNFQGLLERRFEPSDLVQQTLLEAHSTLADFHGRSPAQQAAWLRQILARNLVDAARDLKRGKRDVQKEKSLELELENSSIRLGNLLADPQPSPSELASREEQVLLLAQALDSLAQEEREVLLLRYVQEKSLAEIGERLNLHRKSAARLLQNAQAALRRQLKDLE